MTGIFLGTQKGDMKFCVLFHITFIAIKRLLQISNSLQLFHYKIVPYLRFSSDLPLLFHLLRK